MGLKERLQSDLTEAIRSRDELRSGTIRMVLTAITNEEVSGKSARVLADAEIITVLSREAKKRREAADAFKDAGHADRSQRETDEGKVITEYLPEQLTEDDVKKIIADAIAETGASGPAGMGVVMKAIQPKVAGKADGGTVSSLVKAALTGGN
ncbi:MAG: GatB/YqeY domain-containing protein [Candidatus Nanopelagicaceae bacterium]